MEAYVRQSASTMEVSLQEAPIPEIGAEEVLIEVKAIGVGLHDRFFVPQNAQFPYVIGSEGAGIISRTGTGVKKFNSGDRVIFSTALQPQGGSWATFAAAKESTLIALPNKVSFVEGAALPVAGKTALESMRSLQLKAGDSLFIAGASGAIGSFVIQLAAARGIKVAASASAKNHAYMKSLGAQKCVDYHDEHWPQQVLDWADGGVTAALAIQPGTATKTLTVVKNGGRLITVSGDSGQVIPERNIQIEQMQHHGDTQQLMTQLVQNISEGSIKVEIEKEYPFSEALEALKKTETRHARGKIIVKRDS